MASPSESGMFFEQHYLIVLHYQPYGGDWVFRAVNFGTYDAQRVPNDGQKHRVARIQRGKRTTERSIVFSTFAHRLDRDMTPFRLPF